MEDISNTLPGQKDENGKDVSLSNHWQETVEVCHFSPPAFLHY